MWFLTPLSYGIDVFRSPRHLESDENRSKIGLPNKQSAFPKNYTKKRQKNTKSNENWSPKGTQRGGEELQKTSLFLLGSALGSPGALQVAKKSPRVPKCSTGTPKLTFWCRKYIKKPDFLCEFSIDFQQFSLTLGLEIQSAGNPHVQERLKKRRV